MNPVSPFCPGTLSASAYLLPIPQGSSQNLTCAHTHTHIETLMIVFHWMSIYVWEWLPFSSWDGSCRSLMVTGDPTCTLLTKCLIRDNKLLNKCICKVIIRVYHKVSSVTVLRRLVTHEKWAVIINLSFSKLLQVDLREWLSLPIIQEVALPQSGFVLVRLNKFLHPEYLHVLTPNLQLLQTQLTLITDRHAEFTPETSHWPPQYVLHVWLLTKVVWTMCKPWSKEMKVMCSGIFFLRAIKRISSKLDPSVTSPLRTDMG